MLFHQQLTIIVVTIFLKNVQCNTIGYSENIFNFKMEILKRTREYDYGYIWAINKTNANNKYKLCFQIPIYKKPTLQICEKAGYILEFGFSFLSNVQPEDKNICLRYVPHRNKLFIPGEDFVLIFKCFRKNSSCK